MFYVNKIAFLISLKLLLAKIIKLLLAKMRLFKLFRGHNQHYRPNKLYAEKSKMMFVNWETDIWI